jgi:hypothetical protein
MSLDYRFVDLTTYSGLTPNEAKHLVQQKIIVPDVKRTRGTGHHRVFGFLDQFEARIAQRLSRLPGGMSLPFVAEMLGVVEMYTTLGIGQLETTQPPDDGEWAQFLDPHTRNPSAAFWLCKRPGEVPLLVNREGLVKFIAAGEVVVTIRLDTLLLDLEAATGDSCTAADRQVSKDHQQKHSD